MPPDAGSVAVDGRPVRMSSPADGRRLGIGMVFQDFSLIPALSVAENVALFLPGQGRLLRRRELVNRIEAFSEEYGLEVDPRRRVDELSLGERQRVELIKLLLARCRLLIFDEPTSVLAPHEVEGLFRVFAALREDGYSILFITHKVREALAVSDNVTVLRRGRVEVNAPVGRFDAASLVAHMVGAHMVGAENPPESLADHASRRELGPTALEFRSVTSSGAGQRRLDSVVFSVRQGEILGVAGVAGNGQRSLGEALLGLEQVTGGSIQVSGEDLAGETTAGVLRRHVAIIPEDPFADAMVPEMRVDENLMLAGLSRGKGSGFWLSRRKITRDAEEIRSAFPLQLADPDARVRRLSGGNVQRVLLAGELRQTALVLLAYYPTRGLDVLSAESTRRLLLQQRDAGSAVVLISEDLDELLALSDRLVVMYRGAIVGEFDSGDASVWEIGLLMTGHGPPPAAS